MSDCLPDLVHLVDMPSVQIEDLQELGTLVTAAISLLVLMLNDNLGLPNQVHSIVG